MDAFSVLVSRYQQLALRVAYPLVGDEAEDVVQDALVKAFRNLRRFRPGGPFRAWLLRIVANESSNRRRSAGRRARLALRVAGERSSGDAAPSPENAALTSERGRVIADALAQLPEADRLVIGLRWFAQLSEREMAETLDCAPGTVKSRLARAMERLRALVPAEESPDD